MSRADTIGHHTLWDRDNKGDCTVENIHNGQSNVSVRPLNEFDTFVRDSLSVAIIKKVVTGEQSFLSDIVSSRQPFGLDSKVRPTKKGDLTLIWSGGRGLYQSVNVPSGNELINKWKVLLSKASYDHGGQPDKDGKRRIFSRVETLAPGEICTESYLIVGAYPNRKQADHMVAYLRTKFCRFLVSTILFTQNIAKDRFRFVPNVPMNLQWTDEMLYKKFDLNKDEIAFIESMVRPMEAKDE